MTRPPIPTNESKRLAELGRKESLLKIGALQNAINRQMEALTGCTRDELIGAPFKSYFTDPERAEAGIKLEGVGLHQCWS